MTTRWARVIRGQFVAAFATFAAAFSHGVGGGGHPPLFAVALGLAFSGLACIALSGARLSPLRLAASITISQSFYHGLFSLFGSGSPGGATTPHHHGDVIFSPAAVEMTTPSASGPWMLLAHAAAAAITFAAIVHGDSLCTGLAALARLAIVPLLRLAEVSRPTPARLHVPTGHRVTVPHRSLILSSSLAHRGPPAVPRFA